MIAMLAQTADWVAVDKPAGVATVPGRGEEKADSLWGQLEAQRGERLWVCHRLDRDTSGIVLFARNAEAHRQISLAFEQRSARKTYEATVVVEPGARPPVSGETFTIDTPLKPARRGKMQPAHPHDIARPKESGAVSAVTRITVRDLRNTGGVTLATLKLEPMTGRQHQLRVHLRSIGWPIAGDAIYGTPAAKAASPTLQLRAVALSIEALGVAVTAPQFS
jgi:tRNA pseudouridine32 synthase / 23S rRNA pseudouridine746 synthase